MSTVIRPVVISAYELTIIPGPPSMLAVGVMIRSSDMEHLDLFVQTFDKGELRTEDKRLTTIIVDHHGRVPYEDSYYVGSVHHFTFVKHVYARLE